MLIIYWNKGKINTFFTYYLYTINYASSIESSVFLALSDVDYQEDDECDCEYDR